MFEKATSTKQSMPTDRKSYFFLESLFCFFFNSQMQSSDTSKLDVYAMKNKHSRGYKPICVTFTILLFMPQYFAQRNGQKVVTVFSSMPE
jgi:hypothetical protein